MAEVLNREEYGAYKYQWARYVARKALDRDVAFVKSQIAAQIGSTPGELKEVASDAKKLTFGHAPETPGTFKMGIVGSGVSGLFTGLLIDILNEKSEGKLNISYDILEASGPKRLGGRLYTHRFTDDPKKHQYYDVGAMRFPKNLVMERTFRLFDFLDMKSDGPNPDLIPYYLADEKGVCPAYFNHVRVWGNPYPEGGRKDGDRDVFGVNKWLPEGDPNRIPQSVIEQAPGKLVDKSIEPFLKELKKDLDLAADKSKDRTDPQVTGKPDPGWALLNKADFMSTRQFLRVTDIPELEEPGREPIKGPGYNFNTIEWLETYSLATGWYNQALSEVVLETLDFETPPNNDPNIPDFWCVDGGTQLVAAKMASKLKNKPTFNKQVTAIDTDLLGSGDIKLTMKTTPPDGTIDPDEFKSTEEKRSYFTVFNSTTLGALQRMDLSQANLLYGTKQAIRSLNYGASCKVGIRFKKMWWMKEPWYIKEGSVSKTDLPLRVCVYPSYNIKDDVDSPGVLLCSYSWAQDAQRIGTLIDPKSPKNETELKELMLSNLARLHAKDDEGWPYEKLLEELHSLYITHHAYDWYHDPNMAGAFAWFGPGQFSQMWPEIIKPNGWLFLIGEAASAHHGWIVGALESSVRAMYQLLHLLEDQRIKDNIDFDGYQKAMKFLQGPSDNKDDPDWKLPFVGLPREIPVRQLGTDKQKDVLETPDIEAMADLSFIAAQCISAFYEMVVQVAKEENTTLDVVMR